MKTEFALAFNEVLEDKQLPRDVILAAIESAMASAYRKSMNASTAQDVQVKIDMDHGSVAVFVEKEVSEVITDSRTEVLLEEARKVEPEAQIGDLVMVESTPDNFGRVAAQAARQMIQQRIRDAEKNAQFEFYGKQVGEVVNGVVQAINSHQATIGLDLKAEGTMLRKDMIPGERFHIHDRIRAYVYEVKDTPRGLEILMSRAHRNFLRRLLENEVPEIYHGIVEIRSIAREPGQRAKVAVSATQQGIDPVGACVGIRGVRIQAIVRELHDEKIDVIEYSNDAALFISKAISPARVSGVYLNKGIDENKTAMVVVPEDQLSLAIGREGQNARLAAKLTGWRIDILSITEATIKALKKIKTDDSLAELLQEEQENLSKIEDLLSKKEEGRALPPEDYTFMARFVDRIEKHGEAERRAEDEAMREKLKEIKATIPVKAFEISILDTPLKEHISIILQEAGLDTLGELMYQLKVDSDVILSYNGIGPKTFADILAMVENVVIPEKVEEQVEGISEIELPESEVSEEGEQISSEESIELIENEEVVSEAEIEETIPSETMEDEPQEETVEEDIEEETEEQEEKEVSFADIFKIDGKKFDFVPEEEITGDEIEDASYISGQKKKSKKKKGYTVEYDPDRDQETVRRKHRRDDEWEDW